MVGVYATRIARLLRKAEVISLASRSGRCGRSIRIVRWPRAPRKTGASRAPREGSGARFALSGLPFCRPSPGDRPGLLPRQAPAADDRVLAALHSDERWTS